MRIGAHVHTSEGLRATARYADETGCECVQVFAKSPQTWAGPARLQADVDDFRQRLGELGIAPVFTHAAYLINLGSADDALWERSTTALADETVRAGRLGAEGVVVHMGTAFGVGPEADALRVADAVARAWARAAADGPAPAVLLENAAGAGRSYGRDPEQMCDALDACRAAGANVGLCLDTCHGFAAGWDLRSPDGWGELCDLLEARGALSAVSLIHANDCLGGLGEHRDRHTWIGDGQIGEGGFAAMFGEARLAHASVIVEMPGEMPEKDAVNVARLKRLRDAAASGE